MSVETSPQTLETLSYLKPAVITRILREFGSPVYVYSEEVLLRQAREALAFQAPYGLTVRYAMKANPLAAILRLFHKAGIQIDASSGFEVHRAMKAGIPANEIMLTTQQLPTDLPELVKQGIKFNACSLHQMEVYGRLFPNSNVSVRINPGLGSGHTRSVSVAGPTSSFGIWHEQTKSVKKIAGKYNLKIDTIHSHIGCGTDPRIWHQAAKQTLSILETFPDATTLNLGGGFRVARMSFEDPTDMQELSSEIQEMLVNFRDKTGRKLHLEIEPGTFMVANSGTLISKVIDMTDTGAEGFRFIKLDTGMNDFMRPALHASLHPIIVVNDRPRSAIEYVVVGHNCESTDLLTPNPTDSERPHPRLLQEAMIDDPVAIEGVGAYSTAMRLIGYNSYSSPNEVMLTTDGELQLINRSQTYVEFSAGEL